MRFLSPFLQPVQIPLDGSTALWCTSLPSEVFFPRKLLEGAQVEGPPHHPSHKENRIDFRLQGTPLMTGLNLHFVLLITSLRVWQLSLFSVHLQSTYLV